MTHTIGLFRGGDPGLARCGREVVRVLSRRGGITKILYVLECDADGIAFCGGNDNTLMSSAILEGEDNRVSL